MNSFSQFRSFDGRSQYRLPECLDQAALDQKFALLGVAKAPLFDFLQACGEALPRPEGNASICCYSSIGNDDGGPYVLKTVYCRDFGLSGVVRYVEKSRSVRAEFFMFAPSWLPEDADLKRFIMGGSRRFFDPVGKPFEHIPVAFSVLGHSWPGAGLLVVQRLKRIDARQGDFATQVWHNIASLNSDIQRIRHAARSATPHQSPRLG